MIDVETFLDYLRISGLVEPIVLDSALIEINQELAGREVNRFAYIAQSLVKRYVLTAWQVRQLAKGRYKGFFLRQYKILGHLGTGGMSTVYLAEHTLMQRRVAIKVLPKKRLSKSIYLQRFIREAQAVAALNHPNIVHAYDIDREGDINYIVMEYFNGENLQAVVDKNGPMPFERIVRIVHQAATALSHAHHAGIVHRDVKPGNILVNKEDNVKLLDLGLALLDEQQFNGRISSIQEDTILGTADYLAPEQAIDSHQVDARADIYGLGCVIYFCLTGHPPFPEGSVSKRLLAHQQNEPPSMLIDRPDMPLDLLELCNKMMAKQPASRQQTAIEVANDMERWLVEHGYAAPSNSQDNAVTRVDSQHTVTPSFASRERLMQILKQMEDDARHHDIINGHDSDFSVLGEEGNVNLFDSTASHAISRPGAVIEREIVADVTPPNGDRHDPELSAVNEIERNRSITRRGETQGKIAGLRSSQTIPVVYKEDSNQSLPTVPALWYNQVPVWFWSIFAASVFTSIFLAGVLATLLTFLSKTGIGE
ncbi:MAG: serine/threonine protein kinase [Planctomycetaceae bacterium]|jgi:serine/threonine protein kinase|nr:serine/threonine protein kinase [Planctomycetaceae bacterium]